VYSEFVHVDTRHALESNFWDHGGQYGQESEEGEEGEEGSQEEKEVIVRRKLHSFRIASEVRHAFRNSAFRNMDRRQLSPTEYPHNKPSGRTLMQMAAA
jgi:hypothetical protein